MRFAKNDTTALAGLCRGSANRRRQSGWLLFMFAGFTAVTLLTACTTIPLPAPTVMNSFTPSPVHLITATALPPPAITTLDTAVATFTPSAAYPGVPASPSLTAPSAQSATITPAHPLPPASSPPSPAQSGVSTAVTISPDDPRLSYIGRFNFAHPDGPTFDWPGTAVELAFTGSSLTVLLDDGGNWYDVTINGQTSVLQTLLNQERYVLAAGLGEGIHTARLEKRTEGMVGQATFMGFVLEPGGALQPPPPRPERRIEFVGDSITAGYGVEGDSPTCPFSVATENVGRSFAAVAAEAVGAEMMVTAVSGIGVIRNYNDPEMIGSDAMTVRYGRALATEPRPLWEFQRWRPDLVVINLGTNDFSTNPQPTEIIFVQAYIDLLNDIRRQYPFAPIIAMAGPVMPDYAAGYVQTAVNHMNTAQHDPNVHFLPVPNNLVIPTDYGCDYHPNITGQLKIAAVLLPKIREIMGW